MGFEAGKIFRIHDGSAAGRNHPFLLFGQFQDCFPFQLTKCLLSLGGKYLGDGNPCLFLNQYIGIDKLKIQILGHQTTHGGFAAAHESHQGKVMDDAPGRHVRRMKD